MTYSHIKAAMSEGLDVMGQQVRNGNDGIQQQMKKSTTTILEDNSIKSSMRSNTEAFEFKVDKFDIIDLKKIIIDNNFMSKR